MPRRSTALPKRIFIFADDRPEVKQSKRYINLLISLRKEFGDGRGEGWDRTRVTVGGAVRR